GAELFAGTRIGRVEPRRLLLLGVVVRHRRRHPSSGHPGAGRGTRAVPARLSLLTMPIPPRLAVLAVALVLLHSCRRGPGRSGEQSGSSGPMGPAVAAGAPLVPAPPGTLFPTGVMLRGDRASLQHYLRYVDTVVGANARITYAPQTVIVDRE